MEKIGKGQNKIKGGGIGRSPPPSPRSKQSLILTYEPTQAVKKRKAVRERLFSPVFERGVGKVKIGREREKG